MTRITGDQWAAMAATEHARFRQRLVQFLEERFGAEPSAPHVRTADEVATAALQFAGQAGDMSESQIVRIAIILVAVNRMQVPQERVAQVRALLTEPGKTGDQRLDAVAAYLGLDG